MNTADRSIALVDAAMRRRFAFMALHPSSEPTKGMLSKWLAAEDLPQTAALVLERLNGLIDDEDFKIGPSYFMRRSVHEGEGMSVAWETSDPSPPRGAPLRRGARRRQGVLAEPHPQDR